MALVKLSIIWCIFFDIMVRIDCADYLLELWAIQRSHVIQYLWGRMRHSTHMQSSVKTVLGQQTARYCVCSSKTPSCIHAFVYLTKQMSFAWAWGLVFPSKAYFYGNWEKGKHKIGGKCLWPRELGVSNKPACVWSFLQWNMSILRQKKGEIVELLEDQPKKKDLSSISFKLICSLP